MCNVRKLGEIYEIIVFVSGIKNVIEVRMQESNDCITLAL